MEEVKLVLKPAYNDRRITKEHYKEILRKTVPKVCTVTLIIFRYALRSVLYFYSFLGSGWVPYKFNCPSQIVKKKSPVRAYFSRFVSDPDPFFLFLRSRIRIQIFLGFNSSWRYTPTIQIIAVVFKSLMFNHPERFSSVSGRGKMFDSRSYKVPDPSHCLGSNFYFTFSSGSIFLMCHSDPQNYLDSSGLEPPPCL